MHEVHGLIYHEVVFNYMGKKPKGRGRGTYRRVRVSSDLAVGALAAGDVVAGQVMNNAIDKNRITSIDWTWAIDAMTAGEGPLEVGVAHSDYTAAEIEECLEAGGSYDIGDKIATEQANRLVRSIGTLSAEEPRLNDGRPIKTRLNWLIATGDSLQIWVLNTDDAAPVTTGASLEVNGSTNVFF